MKCKLKKNSYFLFQKLSILNCIYYLQVWFQNRRMKDKRQRMAMTWPYGIPADPQVYAYLAAAAAAQASYPYGFPNPAAMSYPGLSLGGLPSSGSSAFTPLSSPLQPRLDLLQSMGSPLHRPFVGLDAASPLRPVPGFDTSSPIYRPGLESLHRPVSTIESSSPLSSSTSTTSISSVPKMHFPWMEAAHPSGVCGIASGKPCTCGVPSLGLSPSLAPPTAFLSSTSPLSLHKPVPSKPEIERS